MILFTEPWVVITFMDIDADAAWIGELVVVVLMVLIVVVVLAVVPNGKDITDHSSVSLLLVFSLISTNTTNVPRCCWW